MDPVSVRIAGEDQNDVWGVSGLDGTELFLLYRSSVRNVTFDPMFAIALSDKPLPPPAFGGNVDVFDQLEKRARWIRAKAVKYI